MSGKLNRKRKHSEKAPPSPAPIENAPDETEEALNWSDEEGTTVDGIYIPPPIKHDQIRASNRRLIITKITPHFFKSYGPAGEDIGLGPFTKCFNAVIGPNGSGKSNVIDAMLFVFGYRATRIRCKKLSVLIHNSETYKDVQSCSVAVHFCEIIDKPGREEFDVVPGSEFVVTRTAHKDNSSFYELNGQRVQFKEVAKKLKHHGIDLDNNRFLILQGEVEQIALMKSKGATENETGMLEYLEDIIGTNRYKKPLAQLADRVENLSAVRTEQLNRLALIKKDLKELEGPMQEAVGFLKAENTVATSKNFLYQKEIYDLEEKKKEVETDNESIIKCRENLAATLKKIASDKAEKENLLKEESGKYEKLREKKDRLKEAFQAADKKDVQLQAEMTETNKNRKKFKQKLEEEKKKIIELEKVPEKNKGAIQECEEKEVEFTAQKEKLEQEKNKVLENIRAETGDLQRDKEKLQTELDQIKKTINETKSAYDVASTELNVAQSKELEERNKLVKLQETIKNNKTTITQRTEEVAQLQRKIPLTEKSLQGAEKELDKVRAEEAQISREIQRQRIYLEETRAAMQNSRSRGKILDSLMQQKREGKCPGLYGRLGDLGAIDQKYDVAISTACGPLDNIVVDTANTAQWCIEFLRQHGIGRATFIALDRQEYLRDLANTPIQTPENVHRLFDLVKIQDETVRTAFYFALRDTLVADNLDQATRIAYGAKRYRVVTLKGEIIEISGTMSGGGKTMSRGRMGQSVVTSTTDPQELERMQANQEKYEERRRILIQKQTSLESQINTLRHELNQMKFNFEKFTKELQSLKNELPELNQQLNKQEKVAQSTKSDPKQIKALTANIEEKKKAYEEACAASKDLELEVDKLTKSIQEKTKGKLQVVEKKLNEVTKKINGLKAEIKRLRVAITTSESTLKKSTQNIANLQEKIEDAEKRLIAMKNERDTIEEDAKKILQHIESITEEISTGEGGAQALKEEVAALNAEEKKNLLKKVDLDQTYKTIKEKLNECNGMIHQLHAKLSQLKLNEIPEQSEPLQLTKFSVEDLQSKNSELVSHELQEAQNIVKNAKPNLNVIQEYRRAHDAYVDRTNELDKVTQKRNEMKNLFDTVKNKRKDEFMVGYNIIRLKLKEMYQMITLGGDADFEIVDPCDPFTDGVQLNVRPPRKCWKVVSNLSGGEKTLSSLALVFALHYYKPSPLYVMDEIDAALDFKNVSIVAHYIRERTKNAQFIIISLRENMFELADILVGIYKSTNHTKAVTVDLKAFDKKPEQEAETQQKQNDQRMIEDQPQQNNREEPEEGRDSQNRANGQIMDGIEENNDKGSQPLVQNGVISDSFES